MFGNIRSVLSQCVRVLFQIIRIVRTMPEAHLGDCTLVYILFYM